MALYDPKEFPEVEASPLASILNRAADNLGRPGGWCQYAWEQDGANCALGAILAADCGHLYTKAAYAVADVLGFGDTHEVIDWNNAPERTQEEVVAAFRKAAEQALAEQVSVS